MDELAKRFADLADKYGPNVVDAALQAARTEAYSALTAGIMNGCFAIALWYGVWRLIRAIRTDSLDEFCWLLVAFIGIAAAICTIICIWYCIDPWTWTAMNRPELWLAKKAFHI